jgi:hypothetical protein
MRYFGSYSARGEESRISFWEYKRAWFLKEPVTKYPRWGCSLFAALGDEENRLFGRNFDWRYSPALLLFIDPPDGYASVSMVDIEYLGFSGSAAKKLMELSLAERVALLKSPWIPFDGMNEHGLVVGMAAVPPGDMQLNPQKKTVGSLEAIREMLDRAKDVGEAVAILRKYNVEMEGGPPIHYLVADRSGNAALVEFYQGQMIVIPNRVPWHQATNFLVASTGEKPEGWCWRYDVINKRLSEGQGRLSSQEALDLLEQVSQDNTQWSNVYNLTTMHISVVINKQYHKVYEFEGKP